MNIPDNFEYSILGFYWSHYFFLLRDQETVVFLAKQMHCILKWNFTTVLMSKMCVSFSGVS